MKTKAAILVTSFAVLLFVVVGSMGGVHASSSNDGSYRQLQVYSEVLSRVRSEYVEEPNIPKVTDGALHGGFETLRLCRRRGGVARLSRGKGWH